MALVEESECSYHWFPISPGLLEDIFKVYSRYIINLLSDDYMSALASMLSVTDLTAHEGVENWQGMLQVIEIEITYLL